MHGLEELSRDECLRLLARVPVGRIGCVHEGRPIVLPVNFALLGDDVVVRTGAGTILSVAIAGAVVAFEADGWDVTERHGWSVLAQGWLAEVTRPDELAEIATIGVQPWAPGLKGHVVRIRTDTVSGRRLPELQRHPMAGAQGPVSGPETPIGALRLRSVVALHPLATIAEAISVLGAARSPVGELGPGSARLVSVTGLVDAITSGAATDGPADQRCGEGVLVLGGFSPLLDAVRAMTERGITHVAVRPTGDQAWGVLTVADALQSLLWVFDPVVASLRQRASTCT